MRKIPVFLTYRWTLITVLGCWLDWQWHLKELAITRKMQQENQKKAEQMKSEVDAAWAAWDQKKRRLKTIAQWKETAADIPVKALIKATRFDAELVSSPLPECRSQQIQWKGSYSQLTQRLAALWRSHSGWQVNYFKWTPVPEESRIGLMVGLSPCDQERER